jgi:hypothetical protein
MNEEDCLQATMIAYLFDKAPHQIAKWFATIAELEAEDIDLG